MQSLSIVVVEQDAERARLIVDALRAADDWNVALISEPAGLARRVATLKPDVILIDIADPSRDTLEELALASGPLDRPVAMFVGPAGEPLTRAAIEAGVSAYVVDGLQPGRIRPVLDAAIARFALFQRMRVELETAKAALEERKTIDRAKGLLMKIKGLSEEEAYGLLRKTAMDQGRKVSDVAQALVTTAGLLS